MWGVLLLMLGWVFYRLAGSMRFPAVIAVAMFTVIYLANEWGALATDYPFETRHSIYLFMTLLVFGGAMVIGLRSRRSILRSPTRVDIPEQRLAIIIPSSLLPGILGGALWAVDILSSGGGASMMSGGNLYDLRASFLDRTTSFMGQIGSFLYGCAVPGLVLGLRQWLKGSSSKQNRGLLSVLLLGLLIVMGTISLVSGGRQSIQTVLVSIVAVLLWRLVLLSHLSTQNIPDSGDSGCNRSSWLLRYGCQSTGSVQQPERQLSAGHIRHLLLGLV